MVMGCICVAFPIVLVLLRCLGFFSLSEVVPGLDPRAMRAAVVGTVVLRAIFLVAMFAAGIVCFALAYKDRSVVRRACIENAQMEKAYERRENGHSQGKTDGT